MMRILIPSLLFFTLVFSPVQAAAPATDSETVTTNTEIKTEKKETVFYELVTENLKPDSDEFYLITIFGTDKNPRALIQRSTNKRASELYSNPIEYTIGDNLSDDLVIAAMDFKQREVIVKKISTGEFYGLQLSYGNAISRLSLKPDYKQ